MLNMENLRELLISERDELEWEESDSEEDCLQESLHDSESEQSFNEEEYPEDLNNNELHKKYYLGKDGITKWEKTRFPQNIRTCSHNIVLRLPGPKKEARSTNSIEDCFFFIY